MQLKVKPTSVITLLRHHYRAVLLLEKNNPGVLLAHFLHAVFPILAKYLNIFFSAQIINELVEQRSARTLLIWVTVTVLSNCLFSLIGAVVGRWAEVKEELTNTTLPYIRSDKLLSMDFPDVDSHKTRDMISQIKENEFLIYRGFPCILDIYAACIKSITNILLGIVMVIPMFLSKGTQVSDNLTWLNHPIVEILFAVFVCLSIYYSAIGFDHASSKLSVAYDESRFVNRVHNAFGYIGKEQKRALDIRMYEQEKMSLNYCERDNLFIHLRRFWHSKTGFLRHIAEGSGAFLSIFVYLFVCLKAYAGAFAIGSVVQYIQSLTILTEGLTNILSTIDGYMPDNEKAISLIFRFLDTPNKMYQGTLPTEKRMDREYDVEFRDVSFKYPGSDLWALRHVNMKFKVGKRLAIVGENGSGKTTFIKLLCRLYDPQEGQILLNGIDIRKYNYRDYMDVFSIVFQDFQLLSQPLGANVAGASEYDAERVTQALTDAGFGDRLAELPDGLETMLYKDFGENGVEVSGGEAQKIAIARALYKDAPFIILDEPTASLDPIAEAEIYAKFNDISGDKTAIYISHRLSSCKFCDEIAVFQGGAVIQQGAHAELLADESGKYYELWNAQAQYYTEKTV